MHVWSLPRHIRLTLVLATLLGACVPALNMAGLAQARPSRALQAGILYVSQTSVAAGATVGINGCGFVNGATVTASLIPSGSATPVATQTYSASANGCLAPTSPTLSTVPFLVPAATAAGGYTITAAGAGAGGGTQTISGGLSVTTAATNTPLTIVAPTNPVPANTPTTVTLSGGGYAATTALALTITPAGTLIPIVSVPAFATSDATGVFTAPYTVNLPAGQYVFAVTGGTNTDFGTLTVGPGTSPGTGTATFSPNPTTIGTLETGTACGINAGDSLTVTFTSPGGAFVTTVAGTVTTSTGVAGCYNFTFTVPSVLSNLFTTYTVTEFDPNTGVTNTGSLTVNTSSTATLILTPNPTSSGTLETATGCGFVLNDVITLAFLAQGSALTSATVSVASVSPSATGSTCFTFTFYVPSLAAGTYTVTATGSVSHTTDSGTLAVNTGVNGNTLTINPSSGTPGSLVTVNGCGFGLGTFFTALGENVTVALYGSSSTGSLIVGTAQNTAASATTGCINTAYSIPSVPAGTYTVLAIGQSSGHIDSGSLTVIGSCNSCCANTCCTNTCNNCGIYNSCCANGSYTGCCTTSCCTNSCSTCGIYSTCCANGSYTGCCSSSCNNCGVYSTCCANGLYNGCCPDSCNNCGIYNNCPYVHPGPPLQIGTQTISAPSTITAGATATVSGSGFSVGGSVTISGLGPSVSTVASAAGTFAVTIAVPSNASGGYTITALDVSSGASVTATVTVSSGSSSGTPTVKASATNLLQGQQISVTGSGFGPGEQVSLSLSAPSSSPSGINGTIQVYNADGNGNFSASYVVPSVSPATYLLLAFGQTSRLAATTAVVVSAAPYSPAAAPSNPAPSNPQPYTAPPTSYVAPSGSVSGALPAVSTVSTTAYFADGYTGTAAANGKATFTVRLYLFNPSGTASAVTTTYRVLDPASGTRSTVTEQDTVAPGSTVVRSVNSDVGNDRQVSTVVQASAGIVAELAISRTAADGSTLDAASTLGSPRADTSWFFAEGYTGESLQEYLTLFNPGDSDATAQVQYLPSEGTAPAPQPVAVPAHGQVTVNVRSQYNTLMPTGSKNIGTMVSSDHPIVVDRAMYWGDGSGSGKYGYSLGPGLNSGHTSQFFAVLPTSGGSQSFVTVLNPSSSPASVALSLVDSSGNILQSASATLSGLQRHTFVVPSILPGEHGVVAGALLSSGSPVVAEAGVYFGGSPNIGRHPGIVLQGTSGSGIGARATVSAGGAQLYIYNPGTTAIRVQVTLSGSGGPSVVSDQMVPGHGGKTVALSAGADARGVLVRGSGNFAAVLVDGGLGSNATWGGNLN